MCEHMSSQQLMHIRVQLILFPKEKAQLLSAAGGEDIRGELSPVLHNTERQPPHVRCTHATCNASGTPSPSRSTPLTKLSFLTMTHGALLRLRSDENPSLRARHRC